MTSDQMIAPRVAFGDALVALGDAYPRLVVLDADVGRSTQSYRFAERYPDRFYQVGIAEQNMMGIAAGMATTGWRPFVSTFAVFATKRACDQVRVSIAYPQLDVKINGSYGGVPTGRAGATHSSVQDLAIMRAMPNMTVITTADAIEVKQAVRAALDHAGPVYLRTVRCPLPIIFHEGDAFEIGRGRTLRDGDDVTIISTGMMTHRALVAVDRLRDHGVAARLLHLHTLKPIDTELIVRASEQTRRLITVENHSVIGGLGSAVAEVVAEHAPCRVTRMGFGDVFIESGADEDIFAKLGIAVDDILATALALVSTPS
jgi:transketolase